MEIIGLIGIGLIVYYGIKFIAFVIAPNVQPSPPPPPPTEPPTPPKYRPRQVELLETYQENHEDKCVHCHDTVSITAPNDKLCLGCGRYQLPSS